MVVCHMCYINGLSKASMATRLCTPINTSAHHLFLRVYTKTWYASVYPHRPCPHDQTIHAGLCDCAVKVEICASLSLSLSLPFSLSLYLSLPLSGFWILSLFYIHKDLKGKNNKKKKTGVKEALVSERNHGELPSGRNMAGTTFCSRLHMCVCVCFYVVHNKKKKTYNQSYTGQRQEIQLIPEILKAPATSTHTHMQHTSLRLVLLQH